MTQSTTTPGTDAATLGLLYEITYSVLGKNTDGVDAGASLHSPERGGNCMNWVVGHMLHARNSILELLGQEKVGDAAQLERYARGTASPTDSSDALSWDDMKKDFATSQERLRAGIAAATTEHLASPMPEDKNPFDVASVGQMLSVLNFHETYHVGQLGVLRRLAGMDGAIK